MRDFKVGDIVRIKGGVLKGKVVDLIGSSPDKEFDRIGVSVKGENENKGNLIISNMYVTCMRSELEFDSEFIQNERDLKLNDLLKGFKND